MTIIERGKKMEIASPLEKQWKPSSHTSYLIRVVDEILTRKAAGIETDEDIIREAIKERDTLRLYIQDMETYPQLNHEEKRVLHQAVKEAQTAKKYPEPVNTEDNEKWHQLASTGINASNRLVVANYRLVLSVALRYRSNGTLPLMDVIQEGNLALMRAIEEYDEKKGGLSSIAVPSIRRAITRAIASGRGNTRIPEVNGKRYQKLYCFIETSGRKITPETVKTAITESGIEITSQTFWQIHNTQSQTSLNNNPTEEDDREIIDKVQDNSLPVESLAEIRMIFEEIAKLNSTQVSNIFYWLCDYPFEEIGAMNGTSKQAVQQMITRVVRRLQAKFDYQEQYYRQNN